MLESFTGGLTVKSQIGSYISMGVSKLPANLKLERWELIFFIVSNLNKISVNRY